MSGLRSSEPLNHSGLELRLTLDRRPARRGETGFALDVDLNLPGTGISVLFGPSGCGKTTLLRCVAGLEKGAAGRVAVAGRCWQDDGAGIRVPTHRRKLGYVFQSGGLFPHLTVRGNLDYAVRRASNGADADERSELLSLLDLTALLDRDTAELSGGERQRVSLARALLTRPDLLLLDEPLAALDQDSRRRIYPYLEELRRRYTLPMLYVTHSRDEAARLADHLVLMAAGRVTCAGGLTELMTTPEPGLARGPEAGSVIDARVAQHESRYHLSRLDFGGGSLLLPDPELPIGRQVRVRIHARDVSLTLAAAQGTSILNILPARVLELIPDTPARTLVRLEIGNTVLLAAVTMRSASVLGLAPGTEVYAQIKSVALL